MVKSNSERANTERAITAAVAVSILGQFHGNHSKPQSQTYKLAVYSPFLGRIYLKSIPILSVCVPPCER